MKKLLFLFLFIVGLWVALANFKGLATQGDYESIIVNFREDVSTTTLSEQIEAIASNYNQSLSLNSVYAIDEHIYTLTGDKELLKNLKKSPLNEYVDYIEPN